MTPIRTARVLPALLGLSGVAACAPPLVEFECAHDEPLCETIAVLADDRPRTTGLDITAIYLYQGVEIPLYQGGMMLDPDYPVILHRDAVIRVFVTPHDDWEERSVTARVFLKRSGSVVAASQGDAHISGTSSAGSLASTINVSVSGLAFDEGLNLEVEVVEASADTYGDEDRDGANRWPEDDVYVLTPEDVGESVRVLVIPVEYNADGSGRLPDTSDTQLEIYRETMWAFYPVPAVEIEVGDPLPSDVSVGPMDESGWSALLSQVAEARDDYGADPDQYLYGLFAPEDSFDQFCSGGCIAGLSSLASSATDAYSRASIGVGYTGQTSAETMIHEVGHAHGRYHAPGCGAAGTDSSYPTSSGLIEVPGYDMRIDALMGVDAYYDLMSYCTPYWISGYNFEALAQRVAAVNGTYATGTPITWATLWLHPDGRMAWGGDRTFVGLPSGDPVTVDLLGPDGRVAGRAEGRFAPLADGWKGGVLSVRAPAWDWTGVRWDGRTSPAR